MKASILFFLLIISYFPVFPDSVQPLIADWFSNQPESDKYISIKEDLYLLFSQAELESLPLLILLERLQEGAAKKVPAQRLLNALYEEVKRLSDIMAMIHTIDSQSMHQKASYFFFEHKDTEIQDSEGEEQSITNLVHQLSIFNRSGISSESMSSLFSLAVEKEKSKDVMFSVLHGLIKIPGLGNLNDEETTDLGAALITSKLTPDSYGSLSSIFVRGRTYHLNYSTITKIVIHVLNKGGGLVRIEQELKRHGKE